MAFPLRYLSKVVGNICSMTIPTCIREPIFKTFSYVFGCDLSEVEKPLNQYETFSDFFSRRIKSESRTVSSEYDLVSMFIYE